jgi:serine/threonine protein kinase
MNMKYYKLSKEFAGLTDFTLDLPRRFDTIGFTIDERRNVLKRVNTAYGEVVIKSFKGMYLVNRLVYSFFTKSKAERSYVNAKILTEKGIRTPDNIGWVDFYEYGLLNKSYFISKYAPYKTLWEELRASGSPERKQELYDCLLEFIIKLHALGIYHNDFTLGNILVIPSNEGYEFSIVDLNRIRFKKVNFKKGLWNFNKLEISKEDLNALIGRYAVRRGFSSRQGVAQFWADNRRYWIVRNARKSLRKYTLTPLGRLLGKKR